MVYRSRCLMAGRGACRGAPPAGTGRCGSEWERLIELGLAQRAAHCTRIAEERAACVGELVRERPGVAKRGWVAGLPLVQERAVLRLERGEQAVDGGERHGQERELGQGPELARAWSFHRFLP